MTIQGYLVATALSCLGAGPAFGQMPSYSLSKCDPPREQLGILPRISGQLFFLLGKDGKPDTASIKVLKVLGISAAGFRSVGARQLSSCRFEMEKAGLTAPTGVMSEVTADSTSVTLGAATRWITPAAPLAIEPLGLPKDSFPMRIDDRRIEERPRQLGCKESTAQPPTPRAQSGPISTSATSPAAIAQAQSVQRAEIDRWNTEHAGSLVAEVRASIDGKPGSEIHVISVTNGLATTSLAEQIGGCRYVPGRYHGIPIPSFVVTTITVQPARTP
jgi:hypothetical protein